MHDAVDSDRGFSWFTALKYATYALLSVNIFMFLGEELAAFQHTYDGDLEKADLIQVFSATIDTAAWVVLLLLFEIETYVLPDEKIRGATKLALHGIRLFCYLIICSAFYGYLVELGVLYDTAPVIVAAFCDTNVSGWSLLVGMDEYVDLDPVACAQLGSGLVQLNGYEIVAQPDMLQASRWLAWTDVVNSAAWLLVVLILEVDVRLQLRGGEEDWLIKLNRVFKAVLYFALLGAAIYWGYAGSFLDFWDAFLWLFAFVFIEMNMFDWQAELKEELKAEAPSH
jgi:hypothetical protein